VSFCFAAAEAYGRDDEVKFPLESAATVWWEPLMVTVAKGTGVPLSSVTLPEMVFFWAVAAVLNSPNRAKASSDLIFLIASVK
jgi:hypothetical protein